MPASKTRMLLIIIITEQLTTISSEMKLTLSTHLESILQITTHLQPFQKHESVQPKISTFSWNLSSCNWPTSSDWTWALCLPLIFKFAALFCLEVGLTHAYPFTSLQSIWEKWSCIFLFSSFIQLRQDFQPLPWV